MSVLEQRVSFQIFYFMISNPEIVIKCRSGSGGAASSAVGSCQFLSGSGGGGGGGGGGGVSGDKGPEKIFF